MDLRAFSQAVDGKIIGDPDVTVTGVSGIIEAEEGDITFLVSQKYLSSASQTRASCIILKEPIEHIKATQLIVRNPYYVFAKAIEHFFPRPVFPPVIHDKAHISGSAVLGSNIAIFPFVHIADNVSIGDNSVIMSGVFIGDNSQIGSNCIIYPNVVIRENIRIGDRVIIHPGSVIGSDGYGFVFEKGEHYKIPQVGGVIIGNDVEIGSNVSIDRATIGNTVIAQGTKIDNLVQIAHNVQIGEKSLIVAQVGIGGSSTLGTFVTIGGQVGIADHTTVESGTMIAAQSGITGEIRKGIYSGSPAIPHRNWLRSQALFAKLPEMNRKIREIEEKLQKMEREGQE